VTLILNKESECHHKYNSGDNYGCRYEPRFGSCTCSLSIEKALFNTSFIERFVCVYLQQNKKGGRLRVQNVTLFLFKKINKKIVALQGK
jgi:hypothetical protein